jgi:5-(carboxyamino)imidazole ribonucleotide mutase
MSHSVPTPAEVAIIMGSDSDLPTMAAAIAVCQDFGIAHHVEIISAHRTPQRMVEFAQSAHTLGLKVIIAVASRHLQGVDSLYSIVQMPAGIPVAAVAIGNAQNAGLLAVQILAAQRPELLEKVIEFRKSLETMVQSKQVRLAEVGASEYLATRT